MLIGMLVWLAALLLVPIKEPAAAVLLFLGIAVASGVLSIVRPALLRNNKLLLLLALLSFLTLLPARLLLQAPPVGGWLSEPVAMFSVPYAVAPLLATILVATALSSRSASLFLQRYVHLALGPIFIVLGIVLLGLVTIGAGGTLMNERIRRRVDAMGIWGSLLLGILFAASFCPTSAAWFFGLLALVMGSQAEAVTAVLARVGLVLPEHVVGGANVLLPVVYGVGSAVPVLLVASLLAYSAQAVGKTYNALAKIEWWARMATGWLFVGLGLLLAILLGLILLFW